MSTTKAKRHPMLADVNSAISGKLPEVSEEILGVTYVLRLLKPEGEDWVAAKTEGTTMTAVIGNIRHPTLAAALVSINSIPVEQLFTLPDDMDSSAKESLLNDSKALRNWRRNEILDWLREEQDPVVVAKLYDAYRPLLERHQEAIKKIGNFSKRTQSEG